MSNPPRLLILHPFHGDTQRALEAVHTSVRAWEHATEAAWASEAASIEVVVTTSGKGVPTAVLERLPALRLVANFGVGIDAIDLDWCRAHGVAVSNTPDVLTDDVADMAVALSLASLRRLGMAERYLRRGDWGQKPLPLPVSLRGRRVGIVGFGRIGQAIAARLRPFQVELAYFGPHDKHAEYPYYDDLEKLAGWANLLIAACPGGEATRGIVSRRVLTALGPDGHFVNIARGSVVDQDALIALLESGGLAGAGLDVFADEPQVPEALRRMEQVFLQPHRASATRETRAAMGARVIANVDAYFAGQALPDVV